MYKDKKPKHLKSVNKNDWVCEKCSQDAHIDSNCDAENDVNDLNESSEFKVTDVDFQKYDGMVFINFMNVNIRSLSKNKTKKQNKKKQQQQQQQQNKQKKKKTWIHLKNVSNPVTVNLTQ